MKKILKICRKEVVLPSKVQLYYRATGKDQWCLIKQGDECKSVGKPCAILTTKEKIQLFHHPYIHRKIVSF